MLTKIQIKNFQSHKNSTLEFSPGINVIVGTSDAGKSAILRAIRWILLNRPLGDSYITKGEKSCSVTLEVDNEHKMHSIVRVKGTHNRYEVDDQIFKAFGNDVPDSVNHWFPISTVNMSRQLDPHFLVLETGGEVAKVLNETLKIDTIDKAVSLCSAKIRDLERNLVILRSQKADSEVELEKYKDLDVLIERIVEWDEEKKDQKGRCLNLLNLDKVLEDILELEDELDVIDKIATIDIEGIEIELEEYTKLCERDTKLSQLINEFSRISLIHDDSVMKLGDLERNEEELKMMYQEELKKMGRCPFCGKKVDDDLCKRLVENM